jgi:LuxR family maltose regulon positive regulatory protein
MPIAKTGAFEELLTPAGDPIMTAKFLVPVLNAPVLVRPRLVHQLTAAAAGPLTLISAPAGSGKTVLASSWVRARAAPGPVGWIRLDEEDDLPGVFWTYVLTGLARAGVEIAGVGIPEDAEQIDHSLLVRLAARLSERSAPIVLVLDKAETITRQRIFDDIDFLVRHAAGRLRFVLLTRADPGLPLPQYRLEGAVSEIRFADLAFRPDEAGELLASRRSGLSDAAVRAFSHRTGGWAAGLRLADVPDGGTSMALPDPAVVSASDIGVYFRTEVLDAQPAQVRDFLIATSVVPTLVPGLATHLSGVQEAESTLRVLAQSSVVLEAVPGEEDTFRYHPLARDLLRAHLRQEYPARWRRLNRKAAWWSVQEGRIGDAVRQFAAAGDWEEAAAVVVRHGAVGQLLAAGPAGDLATALQMLPAEVAGPEAAAVAAAVALVRGDLQGCDTSLLRARELVPEVTAERTARIEFATSVVALARAATGRGVAGKQPGDPVQATTARLGPARPVDAATEAVLSYAWGCALLVAGDLVAARQTLEATVLEASASGHRHLAGLARARLALTEALAGRLGEAEAAARAAADASHGVDAGVRYADHGARAALAWVASERGEFGDASAHLGAVPAAPYPHDDLVAAAVLVLVRCRLLRARGDLSAALRALDDFARAGGDLLPQWLGQRLAAAAVDVCIAQRRPDAAVERLPAQLSGAHAPHLLALGRVKLATGAPAESGRLARQVLHQPVEAIDLHVTAHLLAASSALALGQPEPAAASIKVAIKLAATTGCRRPFDEAPDRLKSLLDQGRPPLAAPSARPPVPSARGPVRSARPVPATLSVGGSVVHVPIQTQRASVLVQPLTEREREVLGHLDALLPTRQIAAEMFLSVNTVKTHVRAILRKLSAGRRHEAVRRARELGLL